MYIQMLISTFVKWVAGAPHTQFGVPKKHHLQLFVEKKIYWTSIVPSGLAAGAVDRARTSPRPALCSLMIMDLSEPNGPMSAVSETCSVLRSAPMGEEGRNLTARWRRTNARRWTE
jgi:hypothetical protein